MVLEYPVDPEMYPGSLTPAERAEVDRKNFEDDPSMLTALIEEGRILSVRTSSFTITD